MLRASRNALSGVTPAGLWTTALPPAKAGAILCSPRFSGTLNGVIAPITPSGSRTVIAMRPLPVGAASMGTTSPRSSRAACAAAMSVCRLRSASPRASLTGFPVSRASSRVNSSTSRRTSAAMRSSSSPRSQLVSRRMAAAAVLAAPMARATVSASAL